MFNPELQFSVVNTNEKSPCNAQWDGSNPRYMAIFWNFSGRMRRAFRRRAQEHSSPWLAFLHVSPALQVALMCRLWSTRGAIRDVAL